MERYIYDPSEINIFFGVPVIIPGIIEKPFEISDFISISIQPEVKFTVRNGVYNEALIAMRKGAKSSIVIEVLHGSKDNELLDLIYKAQTFGVVGFPLTLRHIKKNDDNRPRPDHISTVTTLVGMPGSGYTEQGKTKTYTFKSSYLQTFYLN